MSASTSTELRHLSEALNVASVEKTESIQTLWSGYGELYRIKTFSDTQTSLIVKSVHLPNRQRTHEAGAVNSVTKEKYGPMRSRAPGIEISHRILRASARCRPFFTLTHTSMDFYSCSPDLDAAGYSARPTSLENKDLTPYLSWLATFHALGPNIEH